MVYQKFLIAVVLFLLVFGLSSNSYAQKGKVFRHADRNRNGSIDQTEWRKEKQWQERQRSKGTNWWKEQADSDKDGAVSAEERLRWKEQERQRLDLNNDGVIDAKEKGLSWRHGRAKVNTPLEKQYDANNDGFLQAEEAKAFLKARQEIIATAGKAKVDSPWEKKYDENNDNIIDQNEVEKMKEDLEK